MIPLTNDFDDNLLWAMYVNQLHLNHRHYRKDFGPNPQPVDESTLRSIIQADTDSNLQVPNSMLAQYYEWINMVYNGEWRTITAIAREYGELLESLGFLSNWFKPKEKLDENNAMMELADLLFFTLTHELGNFGFDHSITQPPMVNPFMYANPAAFVSEIEFYMSRDVAEYTLDTWAQLSYNVIAYCIFKCVPEETGERQCLLHLLSANPGAFLRRLVDVYWLKSSINNMRLDGGLYTGSYNKTYFGREDNAEVESRVGLNMDAGFSYFSYVIGGQGDMDLAEVANAICKGMLAEMA